MNAYCLKCHDRTPHYRTQMGSWFRWFCVVCKTELTDAALHLENMRAPLPNQAAIDAAAAEALSRLPGPVRVGTWKGD
jgi:hypothetical protein